MHKAKARPTAAIASNPVTLLVTRFEVELTLPGSDLTAGLDPAATDCVTFNAWDAILIAAARAA